MADITTHIPTQKQQMMKDTLMEETKEMKDAAMYNIAQKKAMMEGITTKEDVSNIDPAKKHMMEDSMQRFEMLCEDIDNKERMRRYNDLAKQYDKDCEVLEWLGPKILAKTVQQYVPDKNAHILDVCGGSGQDVEELHKHGYRNFDVLDGSIGMLQIAMKLNLYSRYVIEIIEDGKPTVMRGDMYDTVIMAGGHATVGICMEMMRLVKPKGFCIAVTWEGELTPEELQNIITTLKMAEQNKKCKIHQSDKGIYSNQFNNFRINIRFIHPKFEIDF